MIRKTIEIVNKLGMHARPATMIVKAATKYRSDFRIIKDDMEINGKSIMGVMMLAAEMGAQITIKVWGDDEQDCSAALVRTFSVSFDD